MNKQAILDVLNSLEVVDSHGGDDAYILVNNNAEVRQKLEKIGISAETIKHYGDNESFCILALALGEGYADDFENGKFVLYTRVIETFNKESKKWLETPFSKLKSGDIFRIFDNGNRYVNKDDGNNVWIATSDPCRNENEEFVIDTLF